MRRAVTVRALVLVAVASLALPAATPALAGPTQTPTTGPTAAWHRLAAPPGVAPAGAAVTVRPAKAGHWSLDRGALQRSLSAASTSLAAPASGSSGVTASSGATTISLPAPDGTLARFAVRASQVMEPGLAASHPEITTYSGRGLDDPGATVRLDIGPLGLHASVRGTDGAWYVDPAYTRDLGSYLSYFGRDLRESPHGAFVEHPGDGLEQAAAALGGSAPRISTGTQLRTYRLALLSDPTYAAFFGSRNVTAAKVTLVNRVDQIYEDDLAIHLVLIDGTDRLNLDTTAKATGPDGPCGSKPCFRPTTLDSCTIEAILRNDTVLGELVGAGAYDIGHIALGTNGGGVAALGAVGGSRKAIGCTGLTAPVGDFYAVDYVAHEMGHQFGGNHPFNGTQRNCSLGNRNPSTSVEPGSGSSIMAYAGICAQDDLQPHSDPYFSERSFTEIETYVSAQLPADSEIQTVSLRGFDGTDSFALTFGGARSSVITRGVNYTQAGIEAALAAIPGLPAGLTVKVRPYARTGAFDDGGFQVDFGGAAATTDLPSLGLTALSGVTGLVGETVQGGPQDNAGHTITPTGNHPPQVVAPAGYTIPLRTPFALTGSATDPDGNPLTYLWEQNDRGGKLGTALLDPVKTDGPLFRQFGRALEASVYDPAVYGSPGENRTTPDPTRVFPDLRQVLAGNTNARTGDCPGPPAPNPSQPVPPMLVNCYSEFLPTSAYVGFPATVPPTLHFRLTARDGSPGGGGVAYADTRLLLAAGTGPFLVTSQDSGRSYPGGSRQDVTWSVAGTASAPISASQVRITLSRDGGRTWPIVLADATANDGSAQVVLPTGVTARARIRVEAVGNVFFAVNAAEFAITG